MNSTAISVHNISKAYNKGTDASSISVLNNVSFTVEKGECVGIVGPNGSGKTTLLKILSGITKPSTGNIHIAGNTGSMLDVGSGFHPDLTGRENILLAGKLYGYTNNQIRNYEQKILESSGIGSYYDMPLKTYSQGMYLRLAFSMLMNFDMDIYLIDEILSVGDKEFQQKCAAWMQELIQRGKTFILVSHNPNEVLQHCTRCILLQKGEIVFDGQPTAALEQYYVHMQPEQGVDKVHATDIDNLTKKSRADREQYEITTGLYLNNVWVEGEDESTIRSLAVTVCFEIERKAAAGSYEMVIEVVDLYGTTLLTDGISSEISEQAGIMVHKCTFPPKIFTPGYYHINIAFRTMNGNLVKLMRDFSFHITDDPSEGDSPYKNIRRGLRLPMQWHTTGK